MSISLSAIIKMLLSTEQYKFIKQKTLKIYLIEIEKLKKKI